MQMVNNRNNCEEGDVALRPIFVAKVGALAGDLDKQIRTPVLRSSGGAMLSR